MNSPRNLRTGRSLRRRRRARQRGPRFKTPSKAIDQRPAAVEQRTRIGDVEGDLIIGRGGASSVGTLVDRASRFIRLVRLPATRSGEDFAAALLAGLAGIPAEPATATLPAATKARKSTTRKALQPTP